MRGAEEEEGLEDEVEGEGAEKGEGECCNTHSYTVLQQLPVLVLGGVLKKLTYLWLRSFGANFR